MVQTCGQNLQTIYDFNIGEVLLVHGMPSRVLVNSASEPVVTTRSELTDNRLNSHSTALPSHR